MSNFLEQLDNEPVASDLSHLSIMCQDLEGLRVHIKESEEHLKKLKMQELKLSGEMIPEFLQLKGLSGVTLGTGAKIEITEDVKVSLPKTDPAKRKIALDFLRNNNGADIIKDTLTINCPEDTIKNYLIDESVPFKEEETVHPQTLKAYYTDLLGLKKNTIQRVNIEDVPKECGLFIYKKTKIK